jgi:hypothetical protein
LGKLHAFKIFEENAHLLVVQNIGNTYLFAGAVLPVHNFYVLFFRMRMIVLEFQFKFRTDPVVLLHVLNSSQ